VAVLTISAGHDPGYLTHAVATGRENYYLSAVAEHGEPPGIWTGAGCPQLGLAIGSEVDAVVMERLYGAFIDPRDPEGRARLGRAPSRFAGLDDKIAVRIQATLAADPDAAPERRGELIMRALGERRAPVYFFDVTFSVPKSVSLLHASLQLRAQQAREHGQAADADAWEQQAQAVWDAILAANQAMLDYLQREAGYSRAGYHGRGSGRFADAHEWVVASFPQHTSRDGDPQLHVHNAVLNRVLRDDSLAAAGQRRAWRTLDGAGLYAARPAAGAIAERTLAEQLSERLGVEMVARPDGNGWEVAGIGADLRALFSSRRRAITPRVAHLIEQYAQKHGKQPSARAVWSMAQFVTLDSRQTKEHSAPARAELLARWEEQSRAAETQALSAIPAVTLGTRGPVRSEPRAADAQQVDWVLAAAVADAVKSKPSFTRYDLIRMISRHLPVSMGSPDGEQVTALLEELAGRALAPGGPCQVIQLTAPELVPVPEQYRRGDGLSVWRRHGADVYTTRGQLDTEARLLRAAAQRGAPSLAPDRAAGMLSADCALIEETLWRAQNPDRATSDAGAAPDASRAPLSRTGLTDDQALAVYAILTSGRVIDILVGPAGTGKTRTVAALAGIWRQAGLGRVTGLTTSTNAARVLAGEGLGQSHNLADFLGKVKDSDTTRGHLPVRAGDLLVIDEASMVTTSDLAAVEEISTAYGAKILLTGDTAQLTAPGAGGAMQLLAADHGYYELRTVHRFEHSWEAAASLRLRDGDTSVLAEYDERGRIMGGTREQMTDLAVSRWLADHLSGKDALLLATSNAQASDLARRARDRLAALGRTGKGPNVELEDGNPAGPGDLLVARKNDRLITADGRPLANRDVLQFAGWAGQGVRRAAVVRLRTGRDPATGQVLWSAPFGLPLAYLRAHVQLAYAGNVHVAQGRTVDTGHLVVDETAGRRGLYVGMSRGRQRNTAYVVTDRAQAADLSPGPQPSPDVADPAADRTWRPHRLAVLTEVLGRERGELTATEAMRRELDQAASLATLAPVWADLTRAAATCRYEATIQALLPLGDWQRYQQDSERGTVAQLLRAAELAGHDSSVVIRQAMNMRDFAGARSIAAVLHRRIERIVGPPRPIPAASYLARTPVIDDPQDRAFAVELATAMDARARLLGQRAALDRPRWALTALGQVPADPSGRADWTRRAGIAAAYREERGWTSHADPIGPAPDRASPELRASWHAAHGALRLDLNRETRAATNGDLLARRAADHLAHSQANLDTGYDVRRRHEALATREIQARRAAQPHRMLAERQPEPEPEREAGG
jgi:conjugative relaxase-like TrwC/TraI family protein